MNIKSTMDVILSRPFEEQLLEKPLEIEELPTPALVINLPLLSANMDKMAKFVGKQNKGIRPHAKTHKCPIICKMQMEKGAVGVCVAKVSEALCMAAAGVESMLLTSPIVTKAKAMVLDEVCERSKNLSVVVDSLAGLNALKENLSYERSIGLLVDFDVEMGRTGTREIETILSILDGIESDERFFFQGLQHYAGHLMHIPSYESRKEKSLRSWGAVTQVLTKLEARGVKCCTVTGGGTGTYDIDSDVQCITDLQVGSYIFMDEEYRLIGARESEFFEDFDVSLTMACTAISQPRPGAITMDGGYKSFASETVEPVAIDLPGARFKFAGDEHGVLLLKPGEQELSLGNVVQFVTPHCDPTVNLHDVYWVQQEDGLIHSWWPVSARGCFW